MRGGIFTKKFVKPGQKPNNSKKSGKIGKKQAIFERI